MTLTKELLRAVMTGTRENRVEELRKILRYPIKELDREGSQFWYLRPGENSEEAAETCPVAVGFYSELNEDLQFRIYGHYNNRVAEQKPVMYLLLPEAYQQGQVALVLPTEGGLRQRQIQTFDWSDQELLGRLSRLQQGTLGIADRVTALIPQVDWVFYPGVKTAKKLAQLMAEVARRIEQIIPSVYEAEAAGGYLHKLFENFKKELLPTLTIQADKEKDYSFADIYAQTVAYGLFTARVFGFLRFKRERKNPYALEPDFYRDNAWEFLPETNPFLRKLFEGISKQPPENLGEDLVNAVSELLSVLRAAEMDAVLSDFEQKIGQEDIIIRFYEDFLAAYKPQMRESRGVYYTPEPVVSYIVRSVDEMLKGKFNKPLGLADSEVMILDPACGTGTFLLWICQLIHQRFQESPEALTEGLTDKSWSSYVKERLLPRIFGFELLMAPYAIAHLKVGLFLEETGYQFDSGKRLGVYLTNTLEDPTSKSEILFDEIISEEANQATDIKRNKQIMVVLGNPPYSYDSINKGEWISRLVRDYYQVDGQPLGERNPKGLQDDYVKFIRFGQWRIDLSNKGIFAFVTNHGFLDNPTFRGMRQQLIKSFDILHFYDLHGNSRESEQQADGSPDANVFDIQQGVSITLAIKGANQLISHCNLYGNRKSKYQILNNSDINSTKWEKITPKAPFYLFIPQNTNFQEEYEHSWKVTDIFPINSMGITTGDDKRFVAFTNDELIVQGGDISKSITATYRPFDNRNLLYQPELLERARASFMQHFCNHRNLALITIRRPRNQKVDNFFVSDKLTDKCAISSLDNAQLFLLYVYPHPNAIKGLEEPIRPNLSQVFLDDITYKLGYAPAPESIFYYIYAIFHSPTYRTRYAEFLKLDFPRVPLTSCNRFFRQLAAYGEELVALHLMKSTKLDNLITQFIEDRGDRLVDAAHPKFSQGKVVINKKGDKFTGVPENVWNFHVGGYQVCQKWLKDRKGRTLSNEDIQHYQRIVVALKETIELMAKIDAAIPGFPIQ